MAGSSDTTGEEAAEESRSFEETAPVEDYDVEEVARRSSMTASTSESVTGAYSSNEPASTLSSSPVVSELPIASLY